MMRNDKAAFSVILDTMLRLGNLRVKKNGDNEHDEAKMCSTDMIQVEIMACRTCLIYFLCFLLNTVTFIAIDKACAWARTHHLPMKSQILCRCSIAPCVDMF